MFAMIRRRLPIVVIVGVAFAALLAFAAFSSPASATHSWEEYHWGRTSNPFTLQLGDNVSTGWDDYLKTASSSLEQNDWNESTELETSVVTGQSNPKRCDPKSGRVEVCNSKYGSNGWLGLASIWISGGHIVQGTAKMNDTYFNTTKYNTPGRKHLVMCQEVGHTFGLAHVNETYDTANEGTCMDYTNDPDGGAGGVSANDTTNEYPNGHDHEMLKTKYSAHTDSSNTFSSTSAASRLPAAARAVDPSDPAQRGRLVHRSPSGGVGIYERDFGQGNKVITRVIRVTDGTPTLEETNGGGNHNHDDHDH